MTQNKYTNWNVVAVVVHVVYKENKKSVKTDLKILMMRMIFFSLCTKILNDILILIFSKKKKQDFLFCFDDFTRQLDVELLREGQVEVAEVHLEQMLVLQHPQHNFLIFLQRVR